MLAPQDMTDDTLQANIRLYWTIGQTQSDDFTQEYQQRYAALRAERDRRNQLAEDGMPDGIYAATAWAQEPHKSVLWVKAYGKWARVEGSRSDVDAQKTPQEFYGVGWQKRIVRLVAVSA